MGFIGDLFSSDKGSGYQGAGTGQANANGAVNTAAMQNRDYNATLNAQQGIVNNAMGRSQGALNQQQAFANATQGGSMQGLGAQRSLMSQLGEQAQGRGPNPAQAQLAQNTAQNVQNQSAMMGSQRGAGANVGLMGRQAAQQGANIQQQAAGQAATLGAQQQLAAQSQLGALAGQAVGQQSGALQGYNQMAQNYQNLTQDQQKAFMGAQAAQNASNVAMQSNINSANAGLANTNAQGQQGIFGGLLGGLTGLFAEGGLVEGSQVPGATGPQEAAKSAPEAPGGPGSEVGKWLNTKDEAAPQQNLNAQPVQQAAPPQQQAPGQPDKPQSSPTTQFAQAPTQLAQQNYGPNPGAAALEKGFKGVGGMLNPMSAMGGAGGMKGMMGGGGGGGGGEEGGGGMQDMMKMLPMLAMAANKGGKVPAKYSPGGKVRGKAAVKGDSLKNDTVKAMLSPGEIVIPRTVVNSKDPAKAAARFVNAVLAKENMKRRA